MKKFRKVMDKITSLPVLKRRWLYILGVVIFTIAFLFSMMLSAVSSFSPNRSGAPQRQSMEISTDAGMDWTDTDSDENPFASGEGLNPFSSDENFNSFISDEELNSFAAEETQSRRDGVGRVRVLMIVFGALDALCIYMLIYIRRKKKRLEREEMQARWEEASESGDREVRLSEPEEKKREHPYRIWIILVIIALILVLLVELLTHRDRSSLSQTEATLYSGEAERSDITTVLTGSGTLTEEDAEAFTIPEGVKIRRWYVDNGDTVEAGDLLARVDSVSVMSTIVEVQDKIDSLDAELAEYESLADSDTITSAASGRVIRIYAKEDTPVADTMYEDGALMLVSLDGLMAVSFDTDASLMAGDEVTVTLSDGTEVEGRVDSVTYRTAVVTISDEGAALGDTVTVEDADGETLGEGTLYIHSEWKVTGFSGTVSDIPVTEGSTVSSGETLLTLTDTEVSGTYMLLLDQRAELVSQMETLFQIYVDGYLYAPCDGVISGLDTSAATEKDSAVSTANYTIVNTAYSAAGTARIVQLSSVGDDTGDDADKDAEIERLTQLVEELNAEIDSLTEQLAAANNAAEEKSALQEELEGTIRQLESQLEDLERQLEEASGGESDSEISYSMGTVTGISGNSVTITYIYGGAGSASVELPARIYLYKDGTYSEASAGDIGQGDVLILNYDGEEIQSAICMSMSVSEEEQEPEPDETEGSDNPEGAGAEGSIENGSIDGSILGGDTDLSGLLDGYDLSGLEGYDLSDLEGYGDLSDIDISDIGSLYGDISDISGLTGDISDISDLYGDYGDLSDLDISALEEAGMVSEAMAEEIEANYGVGEQTILSITPQDTMTFTITVDETDVLRLEEGQEADVTLDAFPGQSFAGMVTQINRTGTNSGGNTKYTADIEIAREPGMLDGMNASAQIAIDTAEDVLCIPEAALVEEDGAVYVYTSYDEDTDELGGLTEVTTGISDGTTVEIRSGLEEGDEYYYKYLDVVNYESATAASGGGFF